MNLSSQPGSMPAGSGMQLGGHSSLRSASQASLTVPPRARSPRQQELLAQLGQGTRSTQAAAPSSAGEDEEDG